MVSDSSAIQVDPAQVTLDNRNMSAMIRVTSVDVGSVNDADKQYELQHLTTSNNLDVHRLSMTIKCYALSMQFKEILGAGKDDQH